MALQTKEEGPLVYIAGALTGLAPDRATEYRNIYESAAAVCEGLHLTPYLPHKHTDPILHPLVSAYEVYLTDAAVVKNARLVIAFTDTPSFGVGSELAIAAEHETHVVLVNRLGIPVSRMVIGNPAIIGVVNYTNWDQGKELLRQLLVARSELLKLPKEIVEFHKSSTEGFLAFPVPAVDNDGHPIAEEVYAELESLLMERFGAWSVASGAGNWKDEEGKEYPEGHRKYEILVSRFSEFEFQELKKTIETRFDQIEILMTYSPTKRI